MLWVFSPVATPRSSDASADVPILVVAPASVATSTSPDTAHSTADRARLRAGPWALFKRRSRTFAGSVLNGLPGRLRTAAPHGHDECTAPQREPGIPEVCVPGKSMLVGIVCRIEHTRLDEPASNAEHAAIDGEPDRRRPPQRPSSPRLGPRRQLTDADEDERRDGANQFHHDYHPQGDDDTCRALPAPPLDVATDRVEQRLASERPIRAHCCARCPEAGSNHRRDESTPIGSFHTASLSRLSGETSWSGCVYPAALRSPSTTHLGLRAPTCRSLRARDPRRASGRRGNTRHRLCSGSCTSLGATRGGLVIALARTDCPNRAPLASRIISTERRGRENRQIWRGLSASLIAYPRVTRVPRSTGVWRPDRTSWSSLTLLRQAKSQAGPVKPTYRLSYGGTTSDTESGVLSDLVGWAGFEPATSASRTGLRPSHQVRCGLQRTRWRAPVPISRRLCRKGGGKRWLGGQLWQAHDCRPGRHRHPLRSHARHRRLRSPRPACRASMWGEDFQGLRNVGQTAIGNELTPGLTGEALMKVCEGGGRRARRLPGSRRPASGGDWSSD
jgi:hypothetical protein